MKAEITGIQKKPSYRGGFFTWIFFKSLDQETFGKSFRTCTAPEFRNFDYWSSVKVGDILEGLSIRSGTSIDADSNFKKIKREVI